MSHDTRGIRRAFKEVFHGGSTRLAIDDDAAHEALDDGDLSGIRALAERAMEIAKEAREIAIEARNRAKDAQFNIDQMVQNGREDL